MTKNQSLGYLVVEYEPHAMDNKRKSLVRIDGHYSDRSMATDIAKLWASRSNSTDSRIVVVEINDVTKDPDHWKVDAC